MLVKIEILALLLTIAYQSSWSYVVRDNGDTHCQDSFDDGITKQPLEESSSTRTNSEHDQQNLVFFRRDSENNSNHVLNFQRRDEEPFDFPLITQIGNENLEENTNYGLFFNNPNTRYNNSFEPYCNTNNETADKTDIPISWSNQDMDPLLRHILTILNENEEKDIVQISKDIIRNEDELTEANPLKNLEQYMKHESNKKMLTPQEDQIKDCSKCNNLKCASKAQSRETKEDANSSVNHEDVSSPNYSADSDKSISDIKNQDETLMRLLSALNY